MVEDNDHIVRMGDVEILPQQLTDEVRIGMIRVQQANAIAQFVPLRFQLDDLCPALVELGEIFGPGHHPARPGERQHAQRQQDADAGPAGQFVASQADGRSWLIHRRTESHKLGRFKPIRHCAGPIMTN